MTGPNDDRKGVHAVRRRGLLLSLAAIVAVWGLLYIPALGHGFVWDDGLLIENNLQAASPEAWTKALGSHYLALFGGDAREGSYYRPLSLTLLLAELRLFGDSPTGYRAVHGAWHLLNALLIFAVARGLLRRGTSGDVSAAWGGSLAALAFLCLPYTADAVLFLTDVGDLMVLAFALLAALAFESLRSGGRVWLAAVVPLCTVAALLSKETGLAIPPILLGLFALQPKPKPTRNAVIALIAGFAMIGVYLAARQAALTDAPEIDLPAIASSYTGGLALALRYGLAPFPSVLEHAVSEGAAIAWMLAGVGALVAGSLAALQFRRSHPLPVALGVAWLLAISPALLSPSSAPVFAPRYLYVPAAALVLLLAPLLGRRRRLIRVSAVGLLLAGALLTFVRAGIWGDEVALWQNEVERNPGRASSANHLARALENKGDHEAALALYLEAATDAESVGQGRLVAMARTNAARLLAKRYGRLEQATEQLALAVRSDAGYANAYLEIGMIHARDGNWPKAEQAFRRAAELAPWSLAAPIGLAGALAAGGQVDAALQVLDQARQRFSGSPGPVAEIDARIETIRDHAARGEGRGRGSR